ncbi:MAG: PepSY domain-containing protein, partial [Planctomycetes bacterium]|nr:PepSY domain-containing protein [Planctomycetota bacterium]
AAEVAGVDSASVREIRLRERFARTVFEFLDGSGQPLGAVDAYSGEFMARVSEAEAKEAAIADFIHRSPVVSITLLEGEPPSEFRGGPMPVYQVILDHPKNPHLYVSPITGDVLKRRNKVWRLFDFFWMLHIMDYRDRNDFNHWLLTAMSVLAILTSASGLTLWWWRIPRRRKLKAHV